MGNDAQARLHDSSAKEELTAEVAIEREKRMCWHDLHNVQLSLRSGARIKPPPDARYEDTRELDKGTGAISMVNPMAKDVDKDVQEAEVRAVNAQEEPDLTVADGRPRDPEGHQEVDLHGADDHRPVCTPRGSKQRFGMTPSSMQERTAKAIPRPLQEPAIIKGSEDWLEILDLEPMTKYKSVKMESVQQEYGSQITKVPNDEEYHRAVQTIMMCGMEEPADFPSWQRTSVWRSFAS